MFYLLLNIILKILYFWFYILNICINIHFFRLLVQAFAHWQILLTAEGNAL